ncbi:MAG: DUF2203 family protein [Pseudomonadota bacterium]
MQDIGVKAKLFDLHEAQSLMPLVQRVTQRHQHELQPIQDRLNKMLSNDPRRASIEIEYEAVVEVWKSKIEQLGAFARGLWMVEFDVGEGMLNWRHPELSLNYFRRYDSPLSSRTKLRDYIDEQDPDWAC